MQIACIVPTYNGREDLARLLESLKYQVQKFDVFFVDSSSTDGTFELLNSTNHNVVSISSIDFNHGGTRQKIVDSCLNYDIYIFLTQDSILVNRSSLSEIVKYFADQKIGAVCGRQLPHTDASLLAQHARAFNYPDCVSIKSMEDVHQLGIKTCFMSNSFAAYRGEALSSVGGFPNHVIFAEDMYVAAKLLLAGWKVAYAGDAECRHSHNYTIVEEFERYFDMGVFHAREPWIREQFGGAGGEGVWYVLSELKFLGLYKLYLWPVSFIRNAVKLIGYKLGQQEAKLPIWLKRKLSMYKRYWDSPFAASASGKVISK
jgi:rhamnosyltransferase